MTNAGGARAASSATTSTQSDDEAAHILHRGITAFVILNAYPYNTGHLMVAPLRHVGELHELEADERAELMELTTRIYGDHPCGHGRARFQYRHEPRAP